MATRALNGGIWLPAIYSSNHFSRGDVFSKFSGHYESMITQEQLIKRKDLILRDGPNEKDIERRAFFW
jgi:hypothetical protein